MIRKLTLSILATAAIAPATAGAALVDSGSFFTDTASGLDWLDITATTNRSYNDVSAELGNGGEFDGWRYATAAEFDALLLGQSWTAMSCAAGDFCGWSAANNGRAANLINLFGDAYEINASGTDTAGFIGGLRGMTANTAEGCGGTCSFQIVAEIRDQGYANPDDLLNSPTADWAQSELQSVGRNSVDAGRGSFLVRTTVVPLPAAAWLFASSLGMLVFRKSRKAS